MGAMHIQEATNAVIRTMLLLFFFRLFNLVYRKVSLTVVFIVVEFDLILLFHLIYRKRKKLIESRSVLFFPFYMLCTQIVFVVTYCYKDLC